MMKKKIILRILILYPVFICVFLFLPAGSFRFWEAWIYAITLFIPMFTTVLYLVKKDPDLLERRMKLKEKEDKQKMIIRMSRLPFILGFLIPGFDHRFNWSDVSPVIVIIGNIMVFFSYFWVFLVFRENTYTSRIIEVEKEQKVISTGPYSIVRHPMYSGLIVMFLFTPLALGSWWALIAFAFIPLVLILRIYNEESVLMKELPGYDEYCQKIRYRLIPNIW
jgi:protein-S-isoprenylcysteine O-methyltransferase Ste14